mmetsp:Transcript_10023/g.22772  ORF Transcript_10023/g.22772 Transcript_10023/m.22772 type:complete len:218 (+) Transcript_10023:580-1233(+)
MAQRAPPMPDCCCPIMDCSPMAIATGGPAGAVTGCFTGLQVAALFGCGQIVTWLCMIGGAFVGHAYTTGIPQQRWGLQPDLEFSSDEESDDGARRGLDAGLIESHTAGHVYHEPPGASPGGPLQAGRVGDDQKCMVCLEAFAAGENLRTLPCLHRYHQSCVDEWLSRSRECPICKRDITAAAIPVAHPRVSGHAVPSRGRSLMRGWRTRSGRHSTRS